VRGVLLAVLLVAASCRGFGPPPPEVLTLLDRRAPGATARHGTAVARVESHELDGEFRALVALAVGPPRARLQLLPDLGGKVLDVTARAGRVYGRHAGAAPVNARFADSAPRHPLVFIGFTLLEHAEPLTRDRIRGSRREGDGWELDLEPAAGAGSVRVLLAPDGTVAERRYEYRRARWTEQPGPPRTIGADRFRVTLHEEWLVSVDTIQDDVFALPERP